MYWESSRGGGPTNLGRPARGIRPSRQTFGLAGKQFSSKGSPRGSQVSVPASPTPPLDVPSVHQGHQLTLHDTNHLLSNEHSVDCSSASTRLAHPGIAHYPSRPAAAVLQHEPPSFTLQLQLLQAELRACEMQCASMHQVTVKHRICSTFTPMQHSLYQLLCPNHTLHRPGAPKSGNDCRSPNVAANATGSHTTAAVRGI